MLSKLKIVRRKYYRATVALDHVHGRHALESLPRVSEVTHLNLPIA